ncbi:MAG: DNA gyrase inhibitor YacG [Planctomycetota bacterium]|jgi:endogenous inhibitor of DNA gyrase (YacG/DUF329 family)
MKYRCPVCNKIASVPREEGSEKERFFPFCSRRCKLVDLGAWLDAKYKIMSDLKSQDSDGPTDASSDAGSGYLQ